MFEKISLLIVITLALSCSVALAQDTVLDEALDTVLTEVNAEELNIEEPGPFSWVRNLIWDTQAFFTADPIKKSEYKLKKASNQLLRARKLVKDDPDDTRLQTKLENLNESYKEAVEGIDVRIEQFRADNPDDSRLKNFMDKYVDQRLRHQEILERLEIQVPEAVQEKIQEHREEQLEKFGDVMGKLQTSEELKGRLQSAIGDVREDIARRVNRLGIIDQIEEKAAPAVKNEIQNRINEFKQSQPQVIQQLRNKAEELKIMIQERAQDFQEGVQERSQEIRENWEAREEIREEHQEDIQQESFFQRIKEKVQIGR